MTYKVTIIPGDGIGPEVSKAAKMCLDATGIKFDWEEAIAGKEAQKKFGTLLPQGTIDSIKKNKIAIKGPIITPIAGGFRSVNVQLRQMLDLYACLRPTKTYSGTKSKYENLDLIIIRENTEDLYAGIEFEEGKKETRELIDKIESYQEKRIRKDSAISIKPISITGSQRIIKFAFDYAVKNNRKKVTIVHKANIMKFTDGLFLKIGRDIAKSYEGLEFEEMIVDNLSMQLVQKPNNFDVLVLPNLYGDIISDLCAGLAGGLGIAPGANIGKDIALFEPVHGSAPKYAGKNKVNPTATILSGVLLLRYINEFEAAEKLERAVINVLSEGKSVTYDLKPHRDDPTAVGTKEMAEAICQKLQ